jgi:mannosylglucosylglycerate synthase
MTPRAAFLSFRFGPTDGVSVVAGSWMDAFESIGFEVLTVAGEGHADRLVGGLGIPREDETMSLPDESALRAALSDADIVVVENLLTIPLNLPASRAVARALAGRPAILHHHDPPWQRERFAHITELPARDPSWRHVAITHLLAAQLHARGIPATVIYNSFSAPPERTAAETADLRRKAREVVGIGTDETVVLHPVRAIERKNIPEAIALAERLGATYWLLGPAEESYGPTLERLFREARCRVVHTGFDDREGFYAAADHVTFPSTWEGFGNPPIEAALHRRTVSVGAYPVADELRAHGFQWLETGDTDHIRSLLADPDGEAATSMLEHNRRVAVEHFSVDRMRLALRDLLDEEGWLP